MANSSGKKLFHSRRSRVRLLKLLAALAGTSLCLFLVVSGFSEGTQFLQVWESDLVLSTDKTTFLGQAAIVITLFVCMILLVLVLPTVVAIFVVYPIVVYIDRLIVAIARWARTGD
jgi:hypothetical protein